MEYVRYFINPINRCIWWISKWTIRNDHQVCRASAQKKQDASASVDVQRTTPLRRRQWETPYLKADTKTDCWEFCRRLSYKKCWHRDYQQDHDDEQLYSFYTSLGFCSSRGKRCWPANNLYFSCYWLIVINEKRKLNVRGNVFYSSTHINVCKKVKNNIYCFTRWNLPNCHIPVPSLRTHACMYIHAK